MWQIPEQYQGLLDQGSRRGISRKDEGHIDNHGEKQEIDRRAYEDIK